MRRRLRNILIVMLATVAALCLSAGLTACGKRTLTEIKVENYRFEFLVGDTFEFGEGFTVYALYSDNTQEDVTEKIDKDNDIKFETGFDMNVANDYQITVDFQGKKAVYTVYVGTFTNILLRLELDTQSVKTQYKLGESVSYDGIKVTSTYQNAQGNEITQTTSGLKGFTTSVVNDASKVPAEDVLTEFGDHTITVSRNGIKASYKINVEGVDVSTVQGAVVTGTFFKDKINAGTLARKSQLANNAMVDDFKTTYKFGKNFTYISEELESPGNYNISIDSQGLFCLFYDNSMKKYVPITVAEAIMEGPKVLLFYNTVTEYGAENALTVMYDEAKKASNNDLKETVDLATRTYTFSFSGLVLTGNNRPDYYENEVTFTLSENYSIASLKIVQNEWENDQALYDPTDPEGYKPTFYINSETGITTPRKENGETIRPSSQMILEITQTEGERTETNPHSRDEFVVTSFDITCNGVTYEDGAVIDCDMKNPNLTLKLENILPSREALDFDILLLNYENSFVGDAQFVNYEGLNAYTAADTIKITLRNGGVWTLIIKTTNLTKKITFNVVGVNPTKMNSKIRNDAAGTFYSASHKLIPLNGAVYFYGEVDKYANAVQSAALTSGNADKAKIEEVVLDGVKCFKFSATENGTYTIKVTSSVALGVSCEFTFEVGDIPDYENILKGGYSVRDREGNTLALTFTPASADGEVKGTFVYTETPKEGEAFTETYSYSVDMDNLLIEVAHVSGAQLHITLSVNASGKLVLTDAYDISYELTPAE